MQINIRKNMKKSERKKIILPVNTGTNKNFISETIM